MSMRPRRSSLKQKDMSADMLGLSRQEERMLQRAMYNSLRQQSQKRLIKNRQSLKSRDNSMTTRSKSLRKLLISIPEGSKSLLEHNLSVSSGSFSTTIKQQVVEEQKLKRGTRYSPMRKLPLSEMLKSLEDKKNLLNHDKNYSSSSQKVSDAHVMKRNSSAIKKENILPNQSTLTNGVVARRPGRPRIIRDLPDVVSQPITELSIVTQPPEKCRISSISKRIPRTASLVARSSWMNQSSSTTSPSRSPSKISPFINSVVDETLKAKPLRPKSERIVQKRKKLIYNQRTISRSQRISRVILATATQRFKRAKIKEKNDEKSQRLASKIKAAKTVQDSKSKAVIPPELWLDPRGQPVDTGDFINFLIYRDTPYLDKSLKWFALPPHKRKQRLYKIVPTESAKFNETVVYNEKKEGGGREIVVQCQPPRLNDDGSELLSLDSDQTSILDDNNKLKCPASVNSSCVTQAAVDEETPAIRRLNGDFVIEPRHRTRCSNKTKISPTKSDIKSTHIMEIRKRKS